MDGLPVKIGEHDVEIKISGECDGITIDSELVFCQVNDTWPECLFRLAVSSIWLVGLAYTPS